MIAAGLQGRRQVGVSAGRLKEIRYFVPAEYLLASI
jgi:hypothetical protein